MGAAWGRAWTSKIISCIAHGSNTGENKYGRSMLQPTDTGSGSTVSGSATTRYGTTTTTTADTATSGPVRERSFDFHPFIVLQTPASLVDQNTEEETVKILEHIKALVVRFPSDSSVPERWLSELEVNWVLHLSHGGKSGRSFISGQLLYLARSWILALFEITKSISIYFGGCCSKEDGPPAASEFIQFIEATLSKMVPFVDAVVAVRISIGTADRYWSVEPADEKLQALLLLHDALSAASVQIQSSCVEKRDLLSAELLLAKLDEAIWDTMEKTKTAGVMSSSWGSGRRRSSDIHPTTRSFISYIRAMWAHYGSVNRILHDAFLRGELVLPDSEENVSHLTNLTIEMVHSLEEKLTRMSLSFRDQSLKFLFLINNFHFLLQQLWPLGFPMPELAGKIHDYVYSYIQVSWAPVLKRLHNPTMHCFIRCSPLPKFESTFLETYTTQKLWKVPDPEMRKRIREAIVEEVIPGFTEFFKDNTISTPRITPQVMTNMLQ